MSAIEIIRALATAYAAVWAFYVVIFPLLAVLRRPGVNRDTSGAEGALPTIGVIVPARNMERVVARCIDSVRSCDYPTQKTDIYVVADHCVDETAARAREAGASVLVREEGPTGKTYALAWAVEALTERNIVPDLYVIVDASARVEAGFLSALVLRWRHGEDIIVSHPVVDPENQQWFAQCIGLTLAHRNLQNWSRERLGLSAFIEGRGMAYSRTYIERHGWRLALPSLSRPGSHPTEDWRHGVRAVERGFRVAFADDARVITPLRESLTAATQQGIRWERGRMANAVTHAFRLLLRGLRQRSHLKVLAALDAIQPPVVILSAVCLAVTALWIAYPGTRYGVTLGSLPLLGVAVYALVVVMQGRRDGIKPGTVLWAPIYVAWRCTVLVLAWAFLDRLDLNTRKKHRA